MTDQDPEIDEPGGTEAALVDEAMLLLPEIVRLHYGAVTCHPALHSLSISQIKTLFCLYQHSPCSVSEIAGGLGVAMATASEAIERLVEQGLVERETNPANRRQVILRLTPTARQITAEIKRIRTRQLGRVFERLTPPEQEHFVRALRVLAAVWREDPHQWSDGGQCRPNDE